MTGLSENARAVAGLARIDPRQARAQRRAFVAAALALAVLLAGNNLPSALYGLLRVEFGYSSLVQTLLYAVPVVLVVLPGLLVFGTLSDVTGRRGPIAAGLVAFGAGDVLFITADDTGWLFAARLLQGLGIALASAAATATLSDTAAGVTVATPARQRGAVMGLVYFVNYLGLGFPVIGVGVLSLWLGLVQATNAVSVAIAVLCLLLIPWAFRVRTANGP